MVVSRSDAAFPNAYEKENDTLNYCMAFGSWPQIFLRGGIHTLNISLKGMISQGTCVMACNLVNLLR